MGNDWSSIRFGDLYKQPSKNGLMKPKRVRGSGFKFINMGEIFAYDRMLNIPCDRAPLTDKEKDGFLVECGDLLFARQSLVLEGAGKCSIFLGDEEPITYESHLIRVRLDKSKADPDFVYYFFKSPMGKSEMWTIVEQGAGQAGIRGSDLEHLHIPCPNLSHQKDIASLFSALDNKIELNRQTNQTLEQMAQALFKSWFVHFDPVIDNSLAAGNPIPDELQERAERRQQQLENPDHKPLPDDILQLFPSEFELTEELGWVPKGWEVMPVSKIIDINPRVSLSKGVVAKFADMKALPTTGYSVTGVIEKAYSGGAKFQNGDVLLARITPCLENGKTGIVDFLNGDEAGFGSTEFITMRKKKAIETSFIACLARDENFRKHCIQSMVGSSGRQRVQNACFDAYHMPIPGSEDILILFSEMTSANFLKMSTNRLESQSLTILRDTLLPKLISGELRLTSETLADAEQELADSRA